MRFGFFRIAVCLLPVGVAALLSEAALADVPSVVELQAGRQETVTQTASGDFRLVNLNPLVGAWYVLERRAAGKIEPLHLEAVAPERTRLALQSDRLLVFGPSGNRICPLDGDAQGLFAPSEKPYTATCSPDVVVRHHAKGFKSVTEAATDLLRSTSGGEFLINLYKDTMLNTAETATLSGAASAVISAADAPPAAKLTNAYRDRGMPVAKIGIPLSKTATARIGGWLPAEGIPGLWVSTIMPAAADGKPALEVKEAGNLVYLMAMDLTDSVVQFHVGTDHPDVIWSTRPTMPHTSPGPDGFGTLDPLVRLGVLPFWDRKRLIATFAGGFKRHHGAFRGGPWAERDNGTHYGFIEDGVVLSTLKPDMTTFYGLTDGSVGLKVWTKADTAAFGSRIVFARQNGLPLVENSLPGANIEDPNGNWSGANNGHTNTLRAGMCLLRSGSRTYLTYAMFSSASPTTMARVFTAYGCETAMHLDMNSFSLTYAAAYAHDGDGLRALPLHTGMASEKDGLRFVDQPDSRDFFAVIRRPVQRTARTGP